MTREGGWARKQLLDVARREMGACLKSAATGGSSTPEVVREFMRHLLEDGANGVVDSYGSTEFPGISNNGVVAESVELKLVAAGAYSPHDTPHPRGEIVVRRQGETPEEKVSYFKDPERSAAAWDKDGWYRTGDIGELRYTDTATPNTSAEILHAVGHHWAVRTSTRPSTSFSC